MIMSNNTIKAPSLPADLSLRMTRHGSNDSSIGVLIQSVEPIRFSRNPRIKEFVLVRQRLSLRDHCLENEYSTSRFS